VVMGFALLLTGIGLLVLTLGPLRLLVGDDRRRDAKTSVAAGKPVAQA
jgi:hypothetical protein